MVKALRKESKILILDEPTSALTETETEILLGILKDLRKRAALSGRGEHLPSEDCGPKAAALSGRGEHLPSEDCGPKAAAPPPGLSVGGTAREENGPRAVSCIYISHKLSEVFAVADRITVLRDGASVTTLDAARTDQREVIRHMVGRDIEDLFPRRASKPGQTLLRVSGLDVAASGKDEPFLKGVSFEARAGEVLGIGGLMGAGRTELLMHIFGAWGRRLAGSVELKGRPLKGRPEEAIRRGLALVCEDRRRYGLVLGQSIGFNLSLASISRMTRLGLVDRPAEEEANARFFSSLRIKAPGRQAAVAGLSGGNQQKVVLGKALMTEPSVIFLDEPTRGIDVGAKLEVYEFVNSLTEAGKAVVLVSSELPELMGMSDRILMLHEGEIAGEFSREEAAAENLLAAAMGHA
ncbi:MAG: sugar ABC transporter ATP-binding protein [Elusimicrobia bacterium]|nr:sugar ABC transporter ATP-binding protein [Elusimicrobiota bacterium]